MIGTEETPSGSFCLHRIEDNFLENARGGIVFTSQPLRTDIGRSGVYGSNDPVLIGEAKYARSIGYEIMFQSAVGFSWTERRFPLHPEDEAEIREFLGLEKKVKNR